VREIQLPDATIDPRRHKQRALPSQNLSVDRARGVARNEDETSAAPAKAIECRVKYARTFPGMWSMKMKNSETPRKSRDADRVEAADPRRSMMMRAACPSRLFDFMQTSRQMLVPDIVTHSVCEWLRADRFRSRRRQESLGFSRMPVGPWSRSNRLPFYSDALSVCLRMRAIWS
jgi:hypothetical protein